MRFLVSEIRFGILARLILVVLIAGMLTAKPAFATIYMYMDDNGQVNIRTTCRPYQWINLMM